jgi:predicted dehydrogenase
MGTTRVAVIGARGIGKHHAKWFHFAGCDVVAIVGTRPETTDAAARGLRDIFPFVGRTYWDLGRMLAECQPQIVSVCSPPDRHAEHVLACIHAGCHVLCEKPLVWDPQRSKAEQLAEAEQVVDAAARFPFTFGVNLQFAAAVAPFLEIGREVTGAPLGPVREFSLNWTPRPGKDRRAPEWYWNDLSPHALSLLLALVPEARVDFDTVDCRVGESGTEVEFDASSPGGTCHAFVRLEEPPGDQLVRWFCANGLRVDYTAKPDPSGIFSSYLGCQGREWRLDDFMKASIERFLRAATVGDTTPYVSGPAALENLRLQLGIFERARRV